MFFVLMNTNLLYVLTVFRISQKSLTLGLGIDTGNFDEFPFNLDTIGRFEKILHLAFSLYFTNLPPHHVSPISQVSIYPFPCPGSQTRPVQ